MINRTYLALARGEYLSPSELGEAIDYDEFDLELLKRVFNSGELKFISEMPRTFPCVQKNWTENEKFRTEVCRAWKMSEDEFFRNGIIQKPSIIENFVYSAELRRIYGVGKLRFVKDFDRDGNFVLPKGNGFLMLFPDGFRLMSWGSIRKAA